MNPSALIIDAEAPRRRLLRAALESADYTVHEAETGQLGLQEAARCHPEVVVLDLGLRDLAGLEVLRQLREWSLVPVVVLTAQEREAEKVAALDAGADDYVTAPFDPAELLARLRAARRRARPIEPGAVFTHGELTIDLAARRVTRAGAELKLTSTEFAMLRLFVRDAGRLLTQRQILREVWGPNSGDQRQYLRVYVTHLRAKIERDPAKPELIQTETGIGYRFATLEL